MDIIISIWCFFHFFFFYFSVVVYFFFFFFSSRRRHTSYCRDWSSDVCSSDLDRIVRHGRETARHGLRHSRLAARDDERPEQDHGAADEGVGAQGVLEEHEREDGRDDDLQEDQIGRASCRERGKTIVVDG